MSFARMLRRAPVSKTSRARRRTDVGVLGWGVRECSFRSWIFAAERRGLDCAGLVEDFSLRIMSWSSRSAIFEGCDGRGGWEEVVWEVWLMAR